MLKFSCIFLVFLKISGCCNLVFSKSKCFGRNAVICCSVVHWPLPCCVLKVVAPAFHSRIACVVGGSSVVLFSNIGQQLFLNVLFCLTTGGLVSQSLFLKSCMLYSPYNVRCTLLSWPIKAMYIYTLAFTTGYLSVVSLKVKKIMVESAFNAKIKPRKVVWLDHLCRFWDLFFLRSGVRIAFGSIWPTRLKCRWTQGPVCSLPMFNAESYGILAGKSQFCLWIRPETFWWSWY